MDSKPNPTPSVSHSAGNGRAGEAAIHIKAFA